MRSERNIHIVMAVGFCSLVSLMVLLVILSLQHMQTIYTRMDEVVSHHAAKAEQLYLMRDAIRLRTYSFQVMLTLDDAFDLDDEKMRFFSYASLYQQAREKLAALPVYAVERSLYTQLGQTTRISQAINDATVEALTNPELPKAEVHLKVATSVAHQQAVLAILDKLLVLQKTVANEAVTSAKQGYENARLQLLVVSCTAVVLSLLIAFYVVRLVMRKNQALLLATDEAKQSTRAKSAFLAMMSHEIRTPMNGVQGMAELLLSTKLSPEQKDYVQTINQSGDVLLTLINDILDISKIEAGKMELEVTDFDLRLVLEDIGDLLVEKITSKTLTFIYVFDVNVPTLLRGDPNRLRQIILNLVSNAIKFTKQGQVIITISLLESIKQEVLLKIAVEDSGIGISQAAQARLFQSFTQADSSTTRKYGGTGLGLVICKQLSELMGGQIGVESVLDQGSTFWFTARFETQSPAFPEYDIAPEVQALRILVIEHNPTVAKVLMQSLQYWGIHHHWVSTESDALIACEQASYDMALLDFELLDGDASQSVEQMQSMLPSLKIILLTPLWQRNVTGLGIEACISKPVHQNRLLRLLYQSAGLVAEERNEHESVSVAYVGEILVVDDNPVNRKVVMAILKQLGCRCDTAENGLRAIEAVKSKAYDLVLMDCHMPEMDGFEATRQIRQWEQPPSRLPIVAFTAGAGSDEREQCQLAGMDGFLTKPVKQAGLIKVLEQWLVVAEPVAAQDVVMQLDESSLVELQQAMGDEFNHALALFIEDSDAIMASFKTSLSAEDTDALWRAAHRLKGACRYMGALNLSEVLGSIETCAKADDLSCAIKHMATVDKGYQHLRQHLLSL